MSAEAEGQLGPNADAPSDRLAEDGLALHSSILTASGETGNLPLLSSYTGVASSLGDSEELEGIFEYHGEDEASDASTDRDPRFGEGFGHVPRAFSLLNQGLYFKTADLASGLTLAQKVERIKAHVRVFDINTEAWAQALQTSVSAQDVHETLERHLSLNASRVGIVDLCGIIQTLCHLTDLQGFPGMAQHVIGAYVAIFLEGNFSARHTFIKRFWKLVEDGDGGLPLLIIDPVATVAFTDDTNGSDPSGEHEGSPRTVLEAYDDNPLWFDILLEIATSFACNCDQELVDRRDTLLPYPSQLRRLHDIRVELNNNHTDLLQRAQEAGILDDLDSRDVHMTREILEDIGRSIEARLLRAVATFAATHPTSSDFGDSTRGVDTQLVLMSQTLVSYRTLLSGLGDVISATLRSQRGTHVQGNTTVGSAQMREVHDFMQTGSADPDTSTLTGGSLSSSDTISSRNSTSSGSSTREMPGSSDPTGPGPVQQ